MKSIQGTVISTKMQKTAVVLVETKWQHPVYQKTVKRTKKYLAHDPLGVKTGDIVTIKPSKPFSKRKKHQIVSIDTKSS